MKHGNWVRAAVLGLVAACGGEEPATNDEAPAFCDEIRLNRFRSLVELHSHTKNDGGEVLTFYYLYFNRADVQWRHAEDQVSYLPYTCDAGGLAIDGEPVPYVSQFRKLTWQGVDYVAAAE